MSVHVISWVLENSEATLGDRLALISLADHAKKDGSGSWPSVATVARESRMSERNARRCLRNLEEAGRISATGASKSGTTVYSVRMDLAAEGADNLSTGGDILSETRDDLSPEPSVNRQETESPNGDAAKAPPSGSDESDFAMQSPPTEPLFDQKTKAQEDAHEVWDYFIQVNDPVQKNMTPQRMTMLKRALKEATVEECKLAIDGNKLSNWHRERGLHNLSDIFTKGKTGSLREKLDRFITDARMAGSGGTKFATIDRGLADEMKKAVTKMVQLPGSSQAQHFGEEAIQWLKDNGIETRIDGDMPTFTENG